MKKITLKKAMLFVVGALMFGMVVWFAISADTADAKIGDSERLSPIFISSGFGIGTGAGYGTGCGTGIGGGVGAILVLKRI